MIKSPGSDRAINNSRADRGFTLIELMISLLLLAVLLGIGVPSFRTMIADQQLRAVSTDLRIALTPVTPILRISHTTTRSESLKRNRSLVLNPSADGWGAGWSIASPDPNDPLILNHLRPEGVTITGPGSVTFNPLGRSTVAEFAIAVDAVSSAAMCLQMQLDGRAVAIKGVCP